ncbi:cAMP-dependent protein kinase type I-beta regulatory subunit-like [Periplaneta americana]|uniref:cAMP-dependent protein kinase type I-beta regulatory subunit-like n=1 Tax=Periplaneta americana TaxID=6978 RepID=UPI0037E846B1
MANVGWLSDIDVQELGENVAQNIKLLSQKKGEKSLLTIKEKSILMKPVWERTEEEKNTLYKVIKGLKCFRRYPDEVKRKLTAVTHFVYYGPGRVVVRQGNYAHAIYFILKGEIAISIKIWDGLKQEWVTIYGETMGAGDMFGEMSLLHDIPRTATCTTSTTCELLYLKREDFAAVLKATLIKEWDYNKQAMGMFPYFDRWDEISVRECCMLSRINTFEPSEIVYGFGKGSNLFAYFILSGDCQVIQQMKVVVVRSKTKSYPKLLYSRGCPLKKGEVVETVFAQVCLFLKGQCFGIGEDMEDRAIIALTHTECLMCPRQWLMAHNKANIWTRIKCCLDREIPKREDVYRTILEHRNWAEYKEKVVYSALRESAFRNDTSRHDVPYHNRLFHEVVQNRRGYKFYEDLQQELNKKFEA